MTARSPNLSSAHVTVAAANRIGIVLTLRAAPTPAAIC